MTSSVKRPNLYNSILQALLVVSILGFVLSTTWMFITSNACGVYTYGSISLYCLLNTVGIILIQRWHKVGVWLCVAACIVECGSLFTWGFPQTFTLNHSLSINFLPYIIVACELLIIVVPLYVFKEQISGKMIWGEMKGGMDIKHSRHIYQLTSVLMCGVILAMCLYKPSAALDDTTLHQLNSPNREIEAQRIIDYTLLDSVDVTLNEVVVIESMIDSIPTELQLVYNKRIFALKHVLLSVLMTDRHNTLNLKNICKIHMGEFSKEQQKVLDWYLDLSQSDQEVWLDCPPVDNLSDFEKEVKKRITIKSK